MRSKSLYFYATRTDLVTALDGLETQAALNYTVSGLFFDANLHPIRSLLQLPNLGIAAKGDINHEKCYLVTREETPIQVRAVPQRKGGTRYAVDQQANPNSISFTPSTEYLQIHLIAGKIETCSDTNISLEIYRLFEAKFKKSFSRIQSFYVGNEASRMLDAGARLTTNVRSPELYDLRR